MAKKIAVLTVVLVLFAVGAQAMDCNVGGRYENNGDGTVTDCLTGLIWLKNANCTDTSNNIPNPTGALSMQNAMLWVAGLQNGICGLTDMSYAGDWRLPTKAEWMAMMARAHKQGYTNPILTNGAGTAQWTNGDVFDNVQSNYYWSSTPYTPNPIYLWIANMPSYYFNGGGGAFSYPIMAVRGGQAGSFGSLHVH